MDSVFLFVKCIVFAYLLVVYLWAKFGKRYVHEVEAIIWRSILAWWRENNGESVPPSNCGAKTVPIPYGEQIHDSIKEYTNNDFNMTLWQNGLYSDFSVPCYSIDIVPKNNNIDADLPIMEVQALDRFQKCTLIDNLLASRIISEKSQGKVYLHILYASNADELARYNRLLETEKAHTDNVGLRNSAPIADSNLSDALNLFNDAESDKHYAYH